MTKIEWTQKSWNPVTGCTHVSLGCDHCYAESFALRLQKAGTKGYENGFKVTLHPDRLDMPLHWKKSSMIFVNSMSDLFHPDVPSKFIKQVFGIMSMANWHTFQILTKRPENLIALSKDWFFDIQWPEHIWMGVSVEIPQTYYRINLLATLPAKIRFVSCEPLLRPLPNLPLKDIDWVIVGAESGPKARPMELDWAREIRDQCREVGIPFFMKQACKNGRKLAFEELPQDLQIREYPNRR